MSVMEKKEITNELMNYRANIVQEDFDRLYWDQNRSRLHTDQEDQLHFWWQAHALDYLLDGYERTGKQSYIHRFQEIYESLYSLNSQSFFNEFYDDMEWLALALLRAYELTGHQEYLDSTHSLWSYIKLGWNEHQGGGIAWRTDTPEYKNTPANMPAAILSARLHKLEGCEEDLEWACRLFDWEVKTLVDFQDGTVWDGINRQGDGRIDGKNSNDSWLFSYCQGVFIGAAMELYHLTGKTEYFGHAQRTAKRSMEILTNDQGLLCEEGDGDGGLFRGIYLRYLSILNEETGEYSPFILKNANTLWDIGRNKKQGYMGQKWDQCADSKTDLSLFLGGAFLMEMAAKTVQ